MNISRNRWLLIGAFALALLALGVVLAGRHAYGTLLLFADLAHVDLPLPDRRPAFERQEAEFEVGRQRRAADVYLPEAAVRPQPRTHGFHVRAVYEFIVNQDPGRVPELVGRLPAAVRADIAALDLAGRDLAGLQAELILVHGFDDNIIPYGESIALAAAVPRGRARLYLLQGLRHVDRDFHGLDAWRMWGALRALMAQRD